MIPATTPTFVIYIKDDEDQFLADSVSLRVDIKQQDIIVSKHNGDISVDLQSNSIAIHLTQKESAKFLYKHGDVEFQVHGLLSDGTAWKTCIMKVPIERTLTKEILK